MLIVHLDITFFVCLLPNFLTLQYTLVQRLHFFYSSFWLAQHFRDFKNKHTKHNTNKPHKRCSGHRKGDDAWVRQVTLHYRWYCQILKFCLWRKTGNTFLCLYNYCYAIMFLYNRNNNLEFLLECLNISVVDTV